MEDFHSFCTMYDQDMPSMSSLDAELELWERKWSWVDNLPTIVEETIAPINKMY